MDEDKNPAPQTTDAGQADSSAAQDSNINLDNVDPRLVIADDGAADAGNPDGGQPPAGDDQQGDDGAAATPPQPPTDNPPAPVDNAAKPDGQQQDGEQPAPTSQRENKRIANLTRQLKEARQQPSNFPQMPPQNGQQRQIIDAGDYDLDQINGMANNFGNERFSEGQQAGLQTANSLQFMTRLEIDAPKIESKYPLLNPQSDDFDPGITDWMTNLYYEATGLRALPNGSFTVRNPNIRYNDFAESFMEALDTLAASKSAGSNANRAKRAAQAGVRPGGQQKPQVYQGDDPGQMTTEQLRDRVNRDLGIN